MPSSRQFATLLSASLPVQAAVSAQALLPLAALLLDVWSGDVDRETAQAELLPYTDLLFNLTEPGYFELGAACLTISYSLIAQKIVLRWVDRTGAHISSPLVLTHRITAESALSIQGEGMQGTIGEVEGTVNQYYATEQTFHQVIQQMMSAGGFLSTIHLDAIKQLLQSMPLRLSDLQQVYARTSWFSLPQCEVRPVAPDVHHFALQMIFKLNQLPPGTGSHPVLALLWELADLIDAAGGGTALAVWLAGLEQTLPGIRPRTRAQMAPAPQRLYILLSLEPHRHSQHRDRFHIRAWKGFDTDGYELVAFDPPPGFSTPGDDPAYPLEALSHILWVLFTKHLVLDLQRVRNRVIIELLLPFAHFNDELEGLNTDLDDPDGFPLGKRYPIVVRPIERLSGSNRWLPAWSMHHDWFEQLTSEHLLDPVVWFHQVDSCADHQDVCDGLAVGRGVALTFPIQEMLHQGHYESMCRALLKTGMPLAIWSRDSRAEPATIMATIKPLLTRGAEVPMSLYQQRLAAKKDSPSYPITLVWDDPRRIPEL